MTDAAAPEVAPVAAPAAPVPPVVEPVQPPAAVAPAAAPLAPIAPAPAPAPAPDTTVVVLAPAGPCAAYRAWRAARCAAVTSFVETWNLAKAAGEFVKGMRTLLVFGITAALGLADSLNSIDISGLLESYLGTKVKVGDIMTLMSIGGIMLRLVTNTPVFQSWKASVFVGGGAAAPNAGSGSVDEPLTPLK